MTRRTPTLLAALAALTLPLLTPAPAAATPTPTPIPPQSPPLKDDFNGDGYQDLAIGAPRAAVDGRKSAGHIAIVHGTKSGLEENAQQSIRRGADRIPGPARADDLFGRALTSADFDRDGCADLLVGATATEESERPLTLVWGSRKGLAGGPVPAVRLAGGEAFLTSGDFDGDGHQDATTSDERGTLTVLYGPWAKDGTPARTSVTAPGEDDHADRMTSLTAGDVNGDGITDAVGLFGDPGNSHGAASLAYWPGSATGLSRTRAEFWRPGRGPVTGDALAVGEIDRDGYADIVVSRTHRETDESTTPPGGQVTHLPGSPLGPDITRARDFDQDSPGVAGTSKDLWRFGSDLSIGDMNGDGYGELAIGVEGRTVAGRKNAGGVVTLRGSRHGLLTSGTRSLTQDTKRVDTQAETDDRFGSRTKLVDFNGDGRRELAVTAEGENRSTGMVWLFRSNRSGLTPDGFFVHASDGGMAAAPGDRFGSQYTS
ncbi:VCBS repeat-containing protein [Streptomyces sp. NPDC001889]